MKRASDPKYKHDQLWHAIDPDTLYSRLKKHIPLIIEKHLSPSMIKDERGKTVNILPEAFSLDVSQHIVADIREIIAREYSYSDQLLQLIDKINVLKETVSTEEMKNLLLELKTDLKKRSKHYAEIKRPHYQMKALRDKFEDAKRITVRERLMQDNNKDVEEYVDTLTSYCIDLCEVEVSLALARLYFDISESAELKNLIDCME